MNDALLHAFASPVRLKILCCLAKKRKHVGEIVQTCDLAQSAVSQHIGKLKQAGLIRGVKEGKYVYYSLAYPKAAILAQKMHTFMKEVNTH